MSDQDKTDSSIKHPMTLDERREAINEALKNGSISLEEANGIEQHFVDGTEYLSQHSDYIYEDGLILIPASSIVPQRIHWIWVGYISAGKLHILAGVPGTGKTTIAMNIASTISVGWAWPDGSSCEPGNVLIWSGEDDLKDTLIPRLMVAGADLSKIHFIGDVNTDSTESRPFDPAKDMNALLDKAKEIGNVKLIIIDPIIHAVTKDSNKNSDVRNALRPVVDMAVKLNAAVLGITHFSKGTACKDPLERVTGSLAFGAVARVVLVTGKESITENSTRYILARAKSNIGLLGGGFYYQIEEGELAGFPGITSSKVKWLGEAEGTIQELLCNQQVNSRQVLALDEAKDFLVSLLSNGSIESEEVYCCATKAGLAKTTIDRAKKALGITSDKIGFGSDGKWVWSLVTKNANDP